MLFVQGADPLSLIRDPLFTLPKGCSLITLFLHRSLHSVIPSRALLVDLATPLCPKKCIRSNVRSTFHPSLLYPFKFTPNKSLRFGLMNGSRGGRAQRICINVNPAISDEACDEILNELTV